MNSENDDGYQIPPEVYDIGVGWDPAPEVERLLLLARQHGVEPRSALELGCGTGRLLRALRDRVSEVAGIELSLAYAEFARRNGVANVQVGDMTRFDLERRFDLIFTSANTIRHLLDDDDIDRIWKRIADHLGPGGVFIADLELGREHHGRQVGRPICWSNARDETVVEVRWLVEHQPTPDSALCAVEYLMRVCGGPWPGDWATRFLLRVHECPAFVAAARASGGLYLRGVYEVRDPYLPEVTPERAQGRCLVVLSVAN